MLNMLPTAKPAYPSATLFPLESLVKSGMFEYSKDIVQLEDESFSEKLQK